MLTVTGELFHVIIACNGEHVSLVINNLNFLMEDFHRLGQMDGPVDKVLMRRKLVCWEAKKGAINSVVGKCTFFTNAEFVSTTPH